MAEIQVLKICEVYVENAHHVSFSVIKVHLDTVSLLPKTKFKSKKRNPLKDTQGKLA